MTSSSTALLIIDVQQGLCEGEHASFDSGQVIARINAVAGVARAAGAPVIFIQHESTSGYLEHGTEAWQLARGIHVEAGDLRVRKTTSDSFLRTDLKGVLDQLGVSDLVICGMHSEFCVDVTSRRALALGYPVVLVSDGHTTEDKAHLSAVQIIRHTNATLAEVFSFGPRARPVPAAEVRFG